jgi:hypothetical protein
VVRLGKHDREANSLVPGQRLVRPAANPAHEETGGPGKLIRIVQGNGDLGLG